MSDDWEELTKEMTPLPTRRHVPDTPNPTRPSLDKKINITIPKRSLDALAPAPMSENDPNRRKLRSGQMPINARLDLHGMTLDQAFAASYDFITQSYHNQKRHLLIITGKGSIAPETLTLRTELPKWLAHSQLAPMVIAYEQAQPQHGGQGAYYVLLRKKR